MKFPKFIIEDDKLIMSKVLFHKDIVTDISKVRGGGWFVFNPEKNMFVFYGLSEDFGEFSFKDVNNCVLNKMVFLDKGRNKNISSRHNFGYNNGSEIIELPLKD